jgi:hypothetical protein
MPPGNGFFRVVRLARIVLSVSFACCLVLSAAFALRTAIFLGNALRGTGQVVRMDERFDSDSDSVEFAPVFRFVAADSQSYTVTSKTATNPPEFTVGDTVPILYLRNNPAGARIASFWQLWTVPLVLSIIAIAGGLISCALLLAERKRNIPFFRTARTTRLNQVRNGEGPCPTHPSEPAKTYCCG